MKLHDESIQVNAFVDGELDLAAQLAMEERLRGDAHLRQRVDDVRQLRDAVRESGEYHNAPAALRARMAMMFETAQKSAAPPASPPAPPPRPSMAQAIGGWLSWRPMAASLSFAAVLAVVLNMVWLQSSKDDQLMQDVVASHVRSTLGQHLVDVSSSDHHTVKPFLSLKLGFSPPVDELQVPGSVFLGGRVDYLDGRPVAALVYKQGEHLVNSFIWPVAGASDSKPSFSQDRGFQTAHWSHAGMTHWVVSDVNREEFQAVVSAVQQTDNIR